MKLLGTFNACLLTLFSLVASSQATWWSEGRIFCDANNNGQFDTGDVPLPGVLVVVTNFNGSFSNAAFSGSDGLFIVGLQQKLDSYVETLKIPTLPSGSTIVLPATRSYSFTLVPSAQTFVGNWLIRNPACQGQADTCIPTTSCIKSGFNGTAIPAGRYIWLNSTIKLKDNKSNPATILFDHSTVTFSVNGAPVTVNIPPAIIQFDSNATQASTTYSASLGAWVTTVPAGYSGEVFLSGAAYRVPINCPGGIKSVTWCGDFSSDSTGLKAQWKWSAAVYTSFSDNLSTLAVKPIDGGKQNAYGNSDQAGTPENFKSAVTKGARGGGGSNFTGSNSGTTSVKLCTNTDTNTSSPCPSCAVQYPYPSSNPRTSLAFSESEVLRGFSTNLVSINDTIKVWYNDEHALVLGMRQIAVKTGSGWTTNNYAVSPLTSNPGSVNHPAVGSTIPAGDQSGTDVSGRPIFPALFITDTTANPADTSGDWQFGGTAIPAHAVFGTWKAAVKVVDNTRSPAVVMVQPDADPAKNNWNLAGGGPAPAGLVNQGYGAEARWNLSELGLIPGHSYRFYFMVHDGDQNKAGGDAGQACMNVCVLSTP